MKDVTRTLALPTALAAALVLSACGSGEMSGMSGTNHSASTANNAPANTTNNNNKADVVFASMMIPHHAQAISMADTALKQATNPKVRALAKQIKEAQGPEIKRMTGWLTSWGAPVPATGGSDMSGMEGMGDQTGGMMSAKDISSLNKATGTASDRMWLQMMIKHQRE